MMAWKNEWFFEYTGDSDVCSSWDRRLRRKLTDFVHFPPSVQCQVLNALFLTSILLCREIFQPPQNFSSRDLSPFFLLPTWPSFSFSQLPVFSPSFSGRPTSGRQHHQVVLLPPRNFDHRDDLREIKASAVVAATSIVEDEKRKKKVVLAVDKKPSVANMKTVAAEAAAVARAKENSRCGAEKRKKPAHFRFAGGNGGETKKKERTRFPLPLLWGRNKTRFWTFFFLFFFFLTLWMRESERVCVDKVDLALLEQKPTRFLPPSNSGLWREFCGPNSKVGNWGL